MDPRRDRGRPGRGDSEREQTMTTKQSARQGPTTSAAPSSAPSKLSRASTVTPDGERRSRYVLDLEEIDQSQVAVVGGKGAHLGQLSRIDGIRVPAGFCVTTDAFQRIMTEGPSIADRLDRLSRLEPDDREEIRALSAEVRRIIEGIAIPDDLAAEITRPLARLGEQAAYAVRSSATAEDLPAASFAGEAGHVPE